jgi:hypothetical protein
MKDGKLTASTGQGVVNFPSDWDQMPDIEKLDLLIDWRSDCEKEYERILKDRLGSRLMGKAIAYTGREIKDDISKLIYGVHHNTVRDGSR